MYILYVHVHLLPTIQHDSSGSECAPGGSQGNYIMYPSATDGSRPNNKLFSVCSRRDMGSTIENNGGCFLPRVLRMIDVYIYAPFIQIHTYTEKLEYKS